MSDTVILVVLFVVGFVASPAAVILSGQLKRRFWFGIISVVILEMVVTPACLWFIRDISGTGPGVVAVLWSTLFIVWFVCAAAIGSRSNYEKREAEIAQDKARIREICAE